MEFSNGVRIRVDGGVERAELRGALAALERRRCCLPVAFGSIVRTVGADAPAARRCGRRHPWFQALSYNLARLPVDA